jgi:hypothetical protein
VAAEKSTSNDSYLASGIDPFVTLWMRRAALAIYWYIFIGMGISWISSDFETFGVVSVAIGLYALATIQGFNRNSCIAWLAASWGLLLLFGIVLVQMVRGMMYPAKFRQLDADGVYAFLGILLVTSLSFLVIGIKETRRSAKGPS